MARDARGVKDALQAEAQARFLAAQDEASALRRLFEAPSRRCAEVFNDVVSEECHRPG